MQNVHILHLASTAIVCLLAQFKLKAIFWQTRENRSEVYIAVTSDSVAFSEPSDGPFIVCRRVIEGKMFELRE